MESLLISNEELLSSLTARSLLFLLFAHLKLFPLCLLLLLVSKTKTIYPHPMTILASAKAS